jgi:hypothetical protein
VAPELVVKPEPPEQDLDFTAALQNMNELASE